MKVSRVLTVEDLRIIQDATGELGSLSGTTVLITGASGFLGSYLAETIALAGETGLIDPPASLVLPLRRPVHPSDVIADLLDRADVEMLVHDICAPIEFAGPVDHMVHCASPASPGAFISDPVGTARVNSLALSDLLELARLRGTRSVLYLSSSEVYGTPSAEDLPTPETYRGCVAFAEPRAIYAESKRFGEALALAYHRQHSLPVKVARPFHLYGPGMRADDTRLIPYMMMRGIRGRSFALSGDGAHSRTYGYVRDAVAAFLKILIDGDPGCVYNVGAAGPEVSALAVTRMIAGMFGRESDIVTCTVPDAAEHSGSALRVLPDVSRLKNELGCVFQTELETGLHRTADWFSEVYGV